MGSGATPENPPALTQADHHPHHRAVSQPPKTASAVRFAMAALREEANEPERPE